MTVEEGAPDLIIPLVERAEIGRVATAMLFKNLGREGVMATLRDVKEVFRDKVTRGRLVDLVLYVYVRAP